MVGARSADESRRNCAINAPANYRHYTPAIEAPTRSDSSRCEKRVRARCALIWHYKRHRVANYSAIIYARLALTPRVCIVAGRYSPRLGGGGARRGATMKTPRDYTARSIRAATLAFVRSPGGELPARATSKGPGYPYALFNPFARERRSWFARTRSRELVPSFTEPIPLVLPRGGKRGSPPRGFLARRRIRANTRRVFEDKKKRGRSGDFRN